MIIWYCTRETFKYFGCKPSIERVENNSLLGNWYVKIISIKFHDSYLFVNEKTGLNIAIPTSDDESDLVSVFCYRLRMLLSSIGISKEKIEKEMFWYEEFRFQQARDQSVLGVVRHIGDYYCRIEESEFEKLKVGDILSSEKLEYLANNYLLKTKRYANPIELATILFCKQSLESVG